MEYYLSKIKYSGIIRFWNNFKTAAFLAFKSIIKGNRWTLIMIIMVMAFSFINLIFVSSILSGVMKTLDDQLIDTLYANVIIDPKQDDYYIDKFNVPQNGNTLYMANLDKLQTLGCFFNNLGNVYNDIGNYDQAMAALEIRALSGSTRKIRCWPNHG